MLAGMTMQFQYPLRVLGCEKFEGYIDRITYYVFQYPLRVLGCEKPAVTCTRTGTRTFQYPLRVLGCEKDASVRLTTDHSRVSVPSAGSWL